MPFQRYVPNQTIYNHVLKNFYLGEGAPIPNSNDMYQLSGICYGKFMDSTVNVLT